MKKMMILAVLIFLCLFGNSPASAGQNPGVDLFSPQGAVKGVRQVNARFTDQMIPFGDPRSQTEPFDIVCPVKGSSRWADGNSWIYDFDADLPAGIFCEFKIKPGLKTLSGAELTGQKVFSFSTGGPAIMSSRPYEGNTIDEEQIFILTLDAEPDIASVPEHVSFSVEGIAGPVGVKVIEGKEREKILRALNLPWRNGTALKAGGEKKNFLLLLQSKQRFPAKSKISLVWGKGVKTRSGAATVQDQILPFQVRSEFIAELSCERENRDAGCIPFLPMTLHFSAPVSRETAGKIVLRIADKAATQKPGLRRGKDTASPVPPDKKVWNARVDQKENDVHAVYFQGPLPENTNFMVELPKTIRDDSGRLLSNADRFPLAVRTDSYPPLAKFPARFGILESRPQPVLPVTVRNLEAALKLKSLRVGQDKTPDAAGKLSGRILPVQADDGAVLQQWLRRLAVASRTKSLLGVEPKSKSFSLPKPHGAKAFEVIGIPMGKPGLYIVELESRILGKALLAEDRPMYVQTAALVTNLSAHFKWGRESSLVWVTSLDKGEPVKDARITIRTCQDTILWRGKTDAAGLARIDQALPARDTLPHCSFKSDEDADFRHDESYALGDLQSGLMITARTGDDMTFVHSSWEQGIETWRFQLPEESWQGPLTTHTIFDRTLFRAGDTVHMKHILRRPAGTGFQFAAGDKLPKKASLIHSGSGQKYDLPLKWDAQAGVAENVWQIPREAKLGRYELQLDNYDAGGFLVEEFRIPLMRGTIQLPAAPLINPSGVTLDLSVRYLAGGGAGNMPVKLRNEISPRYNLSFPGYDDFIFANGAVKEGIIRRGQTGEDEEPVQEEAGPARTSLPVMELTLDASGSRRATIEKLSTSDIPRELHTEMEYLDPAGEISTVSSRMPIWNSEYVIGIRPDSWTATRDLMKFHVAVLDTKGKPVEGADVSVDVFERKNYSHRKRLIGGFYAYEHTVETKKIGTVCTGKTAAGGILVCEARSPVSGNIILQAQSPDSAGRRTVANRDLWVAERDDLWFDVRDNDRIDLLAEKKRYEPGQRARFQVRMPFREATILVTAEREGVLDAWVFHLSGKNPVIEVPVKLNYAPNVFISAMVVRGRAADIPPTSMVDLGKPAYKLGIAEIDVGWKNYELKLSVTADKPVYKVREKARIRIRAVTADGKTPPAGSEVAVAAVDEGLLELLPNGSWNILAAMMGRRGIAVHTSTAQTQVVGKRHFGLKAVAQGGGGGLGGKATRELFDTLLLWKGRVFLDAKGEADVEVPLNDSVTAFRIAAVATGGAGLFGSGFTSIRSTQDLTLFSGLSPVIREGDKYFAAFTVRNTTDRPMDITLSASVAGMKWRIDPISLSLAAGESREVGWNATAPFGIEKMQWAIDAVDSRSRTSDHIKIVQTIVPATPVRTYQSTITQIDRSYKLDVERPKDAIAGRGGVRTTFRSKISDGLDGVTDYMKKYPYTCMEQKVSRAVSLRDEVLWKETISRLPAHLDSEGLVRYFPMSALSGSPTLTSYILAIAHEAGWPLPPSAKQQMQSGLKRFIAGKSHQRSTLATADLSIRKLSAIEALSREGEATPGMLDSIRIDPNLWPTSAVIDWINILRNVSDIPNRNTRMTDAQQILRSRLNFQGTTMTFSTEKGDYLWWLMVSGDLNAVRALLTLMPDARWTPDMPRLAQGALARQKRGHWDLTLANAWGVLAMEKFSRTFEAVPVAGSTQTVLARQTKTLDWKAAPKGKSEIFAWPEHKETLWVTHAGTGKPWLTISSLAAIPLKDAISSGYKIRKTVTPVEQKHKTRFTKGDIIRIKLELDAQADQTWVVVTDPIPAGAAILGGSLARSSQMLAQDEKQTGQVWPAFEERSFEAFRSYYEYVPKGPWSIEYTVRLNASGTFHLPATRVEAMYFPEMLGESPNAVVTVAP